MRRFRCRLWLSAGPSPCIERRFCRSGLNTLLDALLAEREAGREAVLATVVKVEGSAYRRPGARMLVSRFGRPEGTISGGCLEAEVAKKAW